MATEKLRLSDLGRAFAELRQRQRAGDVDGESYETALERGVKDHTERAKAFSARPGLPEEPRSQRSR